MELDELGAFYKAMKVDKLISLSSCGEGGRAEQSRICVKEDESAALWIFSLHSSGIF